MVIGVVHSRGCYRRLCLLLESIGNWQQASNRIHNLYVGYFASFSDHQRTPPLGANAFLARFSVAENPSEIMEAINTLLSSHYVWLQGHPRENVFRRIEPYIWILKRPEERSFIFSEGDHPYYTLRPYWDGIWFYGRSGGRYDPGMATQLIYSVQEMIFCSMMVLRIILKMRQMGAHSVGGHFGGTQGSLWFLNALERQSALINEPLNSIEGREAANLVILAAASSHYMLEELRKHQQLSTRNELRETIFIHFLCDYLI